MKKIGVSADDKDLNANISQGLGKSQYLCVIELDEIAKKINQYKFVDNQSQCGGSGNNMAQISINEGLDAVITGFIGPGPFGSLHMSGIEVYHAKNLSLNTVVQEYLDGNLVQVKKPMPNKNSGCGCGRKNNP